MLIKKKNCLWALLFIKIEKFEIAMTTKVGIK